jgi:hypothetical protein
MQWAACKHRVPARPGGTRASSRSEDQGENTGWGSRGGLNPKPKTKPGARDKRNLAVVPVCMKRRRGQDETAIVWVCHP